MRHSAAFSHGSKSPWMQNELFEAALGIAKPWYVRGVDFDDARKLLTIGIDFVAGSRFGAPGIEGLHRVHDTRPSGCGTSTSSSTNATSRSEPRGSAAKRTARAWLYREGL